MVIEIETVSDENPADSSSTYVYDIEREMQNDQTCAAIITILSGLMDVPSKEMKPLYSVVNCDAIDALFRTRRYGDARDNVSVSFHYDVYEVTVHANGRVVVKE